MNRTCCRPVDMGCTDFDEKFVQDTITDIESAYATVPTPVVKPSFQQPNEEELYASFEEAMSDRLIALHMRLDHISQLLPSALPHDTRPVLQQNTQALESGAQQGQTTKLSLHVPLQQRLTIFACFALMFLLSGFDLMGILVLHMH
jgi:hypothetical protein